MWHDKQCKLQTHWWTWILHMWEASILVQTQELCPASSNKRLENRRCHQSASGHQWSSASAFAASPTAALTEFTLPFATQSNTRCATESSSVSPLVWSGQRPIPWSPGQRAIGKELQGGSEVFSHSVSQSVREIEREGSLVIFCMGGHRGWASRVFGRVLLTMIMCSYSPMWLEREKQKWGPWQYLKLWQR